MRDELKLSKEYVGEQEQPRKPWYKRRLVKFLIFEAIFWLIVGYAVYFYSGKPKVRVDYLAQLNELMRGDYKDESNAWPYFESASEKYVELPEELVELLNQSSGDWAEFSEEERLALNEWLAANDDAWNDFLVASEQECCWHEYDPPDAYMAKRSEYDYREISLIECLVEYDDTGMTLRHVAKQGSLRIQRALAEGDWQEAWSYCRALMRAGMLLQNSKGDLIEQLAGLGAGNIAHNELARMAMRPDCPIDMLAEAYTVWRSWFESEDYPVLNYESHRLNLYDIIQRIFTEGGFGGGHMTLRGAEAFYNHAKNACLISKENMNWFIAFWHAGRDDVMEISDAYFEQLYRQEHITPYEQHNNQERSANDIIDFGNSYRYFVPSRMLPNLDSSTKLVHWGRAYYEVALTILALRLWEAEHGDWPGSLDELVAGGYLDELPGDPYSGGSLVYRRDGDEFVLYSLGADFDDDGGVQDPNSSWGQGDDGGDRVFWPRGGINQ
ncbi:MAG: hypothetical protein JW936_10470 [Sedimentisphaerales bacterium]|nr:hypothetical protein [Sedimentisphaerales bacterium]